MGYRRAGGVLEGATSEHRRRSIPKPPTPHLTHAYPRTGIGSSDWQRRLLGPGTAHPPRWAHQV
jgi:hypothetical protein